MATCCGDCIHNAVCEIDGYISKCEHFKNKANYAVLKHGEWIQEWEPQPLLDDYDEIPYIKCSLCGHEEWNIDIESGNAPNYCENCGAKMDGSDKK